MKHKRLIAAATIAAMIAASAHAACFIAFDCDNEKTAQAMGITSAELLARRLAAIDRGDYSAPELEFLKEPEPAEHQLSMREEWEFLHRQSELAMQKFEAEKAERRRAAGYRDPAGSIRLCSHMTENGCR